MKISDILNKNKPCLSFEVFPPKTTTAFESVKEATERIAELHPAFMSVTYGAGGGTSKYTIEIAKNINERHRVPSLAHLTCVSSDKHTVRTRIAEIKAAGIENVMALRGDIPADMQSADRSLWDYRHAIDLVREIKNSAPELCIGGACYPEVHPESANADEDIRHLREKVDAGCDFLTTQMFFDNELFYNFLDKARAVGITVPIVPGIMPITSAAQIDRAIKLSGSYIPKRFLDIVEKYGCDPVAMQDAGIEYATEQINALYDGGVPCVHVYSMNKVEVAKRILHDVSPKLKHELQYTN